MNLLLWLIFFPANTSPIHDFKIANYVVSRTNEEIKMAARIDRLDFLEAVKSCKTMDGDCFTNYLKEHFTMVFDERKVNFTYKSHSYSKDFIELQFHLGTFPETVKKIEIFNNALLELSDRQENVVKFQLSGKVRSFRLDKDRMRTRVEY